MLLSSDELLLFYKLHHSLMCFVNGRLEIVPDVRNPDEFAVLPPESRLPVRDALAERLDLIDLFCESNPYDLPDGELEIVRSWRHQVAGRFFIFRYLKHYTVFLSTEEPATAYGVLALYDSFEELIGPHLPCWAGTVLLPFRGKIIYDGLLNGYNISFGGGFKRSLNESYKEAKARLGIVTSLPATAKPAAKKKPPKKTKRKTRKSAAEEVRPVLEAIVGMIDEFCREHLNDEYAELCRKLAEKLSRKRPSPLLRGRPTTWAAGIVRTIGWQNYLDDKNQTPHMRLTDIDACFGIATSTGAAKSATIRKMLKIRKFDHEWMLPSQMDDNPLVWMLEVNGFLMDIRDCPLEAQEVAFEKGLIPYIPGERQEAG